MDRSPSRRAERKPAVSFSITGALGGILLCAACFLAWIESPLRGRVASPPALVLVGLAALIVLAAIMGWSRIATIAACGALGLCFLTLLGLAVRDARLWSLVSDNTQYSAIIRFSDLHLPWNKGADPMLVKGLATDGVTDRLSTSLYFMGRGWWLCVGGALVVLGGCIRVQAFRTITWAAGAMGVAAALVALVLVKPLAAEARSARADRDMALGDFATAIHGYLMAQGHSRQLTLSEAVWRHVGEAHYRLGRTSDPSARFYVAGRDSAKIGFDDGIREYMPLALGQDEVLRSLARRELANAYAAKGVVSYSQGNVEAAVSRWEQSLDLDPAQMQSAFFLSRGYYDLGRFNASIAVGRRAAAEIRDHRILADIQCNIGDSLTRLSLFEDARKAYETARRLDSSQNYRMFRSLGGT